MKITEVNVVVMKKDFSFARPDLMMDNVSMPAYCCSRSKTWHKTGFVLNKKKLFYLNKEPLINHLLKLEVFFPPRGV